MISTTGSGNWYKWASRAKSPVFQRQKDINVMFHFCNHIKLLAVNKHLKEEYFGKYKAPWMVIRNVSLVVWTNGFDDYVWFLEETYYEPSRALWTWNALEILEILELMNAAAYPSLSVCVSMLSCWYMLDFRLSI